VVRIVEVDYTAKPALKGHLNIKNHCL